MKLLYILFLITGITVFAQDNSIRIGIIDHVKIQENSNRGKAIFSHINDYAKSINNQLSTMIDEIKQLDNQLASSSINPTGKKILTDQRNSLELKIQKFHDESELEILKLGDKAALEYTTEILPIINELATKHQLQIILQYKPEIMFTTDEKTMLSFTEEIINLYNSKYA